MSISYVTSAAAAGNTAGNVSCAIGDVICVFAYRDGSLSAPTLATGFNNWPGTPTGTGNTQSARLGWKIAESTTESTGTWANATGCVAVVYRGCVPSPAVAWSTGSTNSIGYPALTPLAIDGTSWGLRFAGHRTATNLLTNAPSTAPNTARAGVATECRALDSNGGLSAAITAGTQSVSAASGWEAVTTELVEIGYPDTDLFVVDYNAKQVYKMTPGGVQSSVGFTGLGYPYGAAVDASGNVYVADYTAKQVYKMTPGGVQSSVGFTGVGGLYGVAVDSAGNVFATDFDNKQVYKMTPGGVQSSVGFTVSGNIYAVAVDASGNIFTADSTAKQVYKMTPGGVQSSLGFTGITPSSGGVAVDASGNVYVADYTAKQVYKMTPGGVQSSVGFTGMNALSGLAVDYLGNVYVADTANKQVYKMTPGGVQSTLNFAGPNGYWGVAAGPPVSVGSALKAFISGAWKSGVLKRYDGSGWVKAQPRVYDGTAWA